MEQIKQINDINIEQSLIMGLNQFSSEIVQHTEERKRLEMQYESLRQHTSKLADHAINCQVKNLRLDQSLQNAAKEKENLVRYLNKLVLNRSEPMTVYFDTGCVTQYRSLYYNPKNKYFSLADEKRILERENEKLHRKLKMMLSILDKENLKEFSSKNGF